MADLINNDSSGSRRIALRSEYDGSRFHGWQIQQRQRTVQQVLSDALAELVGHEVNLIGCSRTDAGVHALAHVSHFTTTGTIPAERLPFALNSRLPPDLTVHEAAAVGPGFHARFGTVGKTYRYLIHLSRTPAALLAGRVAFLPFSLDISAMQAAAGYLIGEHDFSAFMDAGSTKKSTTRRLDRLEIQQDGKQVMIEVTGSGFLYHMVRIIAGTLTAVGHGKIQPERIPDLIESRDRRQTGKTMPACGLYLTQVVYEPPVFAQEDAAAERRWQAGGMNHV